jgi:16S rRNA (guanine966-N2)-methyltransferase
MRIIGGRWRGRRLVCPPGNATRPTAERLRQTLFDMLAHAPWAGSDRLRGAHVLDAFAGTGALGLEALSRGAATAHFFECDHAALAALRANITRCDAAAVALLAGTDATRPPQAGQPCSLVFLDPPYRRNLAEAALAALQRAGWIAPAALLVSESGGDEAPGFTATLLAERHTAAARLTVWRLPG